MRVMMLAAAAALAVCGPALAQGPLATAPSGGAAMPQPKGSQALPPPGPGYGEVNEVAFGPCGYTQAAPKSPHRAAATVPAPFLQPADPFDSLILAAWRLILPLG